MDLYEEKPEEKSAVEPLFLTGVLSGLSANAGM
jgi:hypothetical protein